MRSEPGPRERNAVSARSGRSSGQLRVAVPAADLSMAELHDVLRLRVNVFVVEQRCAYPEIDGADLLPGTRHFWCTVDGEVVAYLRVLAYTDGVLRIGRACTAASVRGAGFGKRLLGAGLEYVGDTDCVLDAQTHAKGFYASFGFQPEGTEFVEDGIDHITMWRRVAPLQ